MKKHFFSLLALASGLLALPAQAQTLPNGGLDTWVQRGVSEAPTDWLISDDIAASQGFPIATNTVVKTATARTRPFAAQLQTQLFPIFGEQPGALILGNRLLTGGDFPGGARFTSRPARLEWYYKLSGGQLALDDSASVKVLLTATVGRVRTVVGGGVFLFRNLAATYTLASLPLTYVSGLQPDSVRMVFTSGDADVKHVGTVLTIDDIAFVGTAAATRDAALNAALSVAPNPSPDGRYLLTATDGLLAAPLVVLDATGRTVRREAAPATAATTRILDLSELREGIYTLQLLTPRGLVTRKLAR